MQQKWRASLTHLGGNGGREAGVRFHMQDPQGLPPACTLQDPAPPACAPTFLCSPLFPYLKAHLTHLCTCHPATRKAVLDIYILDPACHWGLTPKCHLCNEAA